MFWWYVLYFLIAYFSLAFLANFFGQSYHVKYIVVQYDINEFGLSELRKYKFFNKTFKSVETEGSGYIGGDISIPPSPIKRKTKAEIESIITKRQINSAHVKFKAENFPKVVS